MDWRDHIVQDPLILAGKPSLRGTRISVDLILRVTAAGWTREEILDNYPTVTDDMVRAVYAYAADVMEADVSLPRAA